MFHHTVTCIRSAGPPPVSVHRATIASARVLEGWRVAHTSANWAQVLQPVAQPASQSSPLPIRTVNVPGSTCAASGRAEAGCRGRGLSLLALPLGAFDGSVQLNTSIGVLQLERPLPAGPGPFSCCRRRKRTWTRR